MPDPTPHPESPDDTLADALAALTEADIPPADEDRAFLDPDSGCPPEYADLTSAELDELIAAGPEPVPDIGPAGAIPRDGTGSRAGFGQEGVLDVLPAGVPLAGFADDAHAQLGALNDDELIGVLRAWRRQTCWAQARELAAIAELARRRPADRTAPPEPGRFPATLSEFTADEIAMALTLTRVGAIGHLDLALTLARHPATAAALEAGRIDLYKATIILDMITLLSPEHAAAVETAVLPQAEGQTSGQLRAAIKRLVLLLDPDAMRRRREEAQKGARVECWTDPEGTATLTGRWLPPTEVLTADKRLRQVAAWWKKQIRAAWKQADPDGELPRPEHGTDLLRARAYLALLLGQPVDTAPADLLPPPTAATPGEYGSPVPASGPDGTPNADGTPGNSAPVPGPGKTPNPDNQQPPADLDGASRTNDRHAPDGSLSGPSADGQQVPAGLRRPGRIGGTGRGDPFAALPPMPGLINLTIPLTTLLGLSSNPGETAGFGPVHADTARQLACALAGHRATRWQILVTNPDGQALAAGIARGPAGPQSGSGWSVQVVAEPIATSHCDHRNQEPGYRPSPGLQRLVRARTSTCTGPGCRCPATRTDLDHTIGYDDGGITCECDLACGCRHCHRRKQALGWKLEQPVPGVMIWISPSGRRYATFPSKHPT